MTGHKPKTGILGAGKSGIAAALLAAQKGHDVFVSEALPEFAPGVQDILTQAAIDFEYGGHSDRILTMDEIIISPGIDPRQPFIQKIEAARIPIISEIEFAQRYINGKIIAITGSNGKSTTTKLTGELLKHHGVQVFYGGNLGEPLSNGVRENTDPETVFVVEVSSFQLEKLMDFAPAVGVILNLTPDHLDRYNAVQDYYAAKFNLTKNFTSGNTFIFNADDRLLSSFASELNATRRSFGLGAGAQRDAYYADNIIHLGELSLNTENFRLKGLHNMQNVMASLLAVQEIIPLEPTRTEQFLQQFAGLEHRLEFVDNIAGVSFYNDSKATTLESLQVALHSFNQVVLIAGGKNKGADFSRLRKDVANKAAHVIAIGACAADIQQKWSTVVLVETESDFARAIHKAFTIARAKQLPVLLSPACASFDMFANFEDRGRQFKNLVRGLK
jgi:UDP-N-acetylmuramoylalanine--D-glutamate ligase